jgi:hypothetical protein
MQTHTVQFSQHARPPPPPLVVAARSNHTANPTTTTTTTMTMQHSYLPGKPLHGMNPFVKLNDWSSDDLSAQIAALGSDPLFQQVSHAIKLSGLDGWTLKVELAASPRWRLTKSSMCRLRTGTAVMVFPSW